MTSAGPSCYLPGWGAQSDRPRQQRDPPLRQTTRRLAHPVVRGPGAPGESAQPVWAVPPHPVGVRVAVGLAPVVLVVVPDKLTPFSCLLFQLILKAYRAVGKFMDELADSEHRL